MEVLFHVKLYFLLYSILLNTALLLNKSNQSSKLSNLVFVPSTSNCSTKRV
jgi:hypothetical protein